MEMFFSEKSPVPRHGVPSSAYASQAVEAIRMIHNSFVIMTDKLKVELQRNMITDKEYNDWLQCFQSLKKGWLNREVKTSDDVLFLQWMDKSSMEEAKKFFK